MTLNYFEARAKLSGEEDSHTENPGYTGLEAGSLSMEAALAAAEELRAELDAGQQ